MQQPEMQKPEAGVKRTGVVAVMLQDLRLLVIQRSAHVVAPHAYCFPGGAIEAGETEEQALRREMMEELGVEVVPRRRLWRSVTPWGVALAWWHCELPLHAVLTPHPGEIASCQWLTTDEMERLPGLLESNRHFLQAWRGGEFQVPWSTD